MHAAVHAIAHAIVHTILHAIVHTAVPCSLHAIEWRRIRGALRTRRQCRTVRQPLQASCSQCRALADNYWREAKRPEQRRLVGRAGGVGGLRQGEGGGGGEARVEEVRGGEICEICEAVV